MFDRLFLPLLLSRAYKDKDYQEAAIVLLCRMVRPCSALIPVAYKSRLTAERFKPFKPQEEDRL